VSTKPAQKKALTVVRYFMRLLFIIILCLFVVVSCTTVRVSEREKVKKDQELTADNFNNINGVFSNKNNDHVSDDLFSLWKRLFSDSRRINNWKEAIVKLEVNGKSMLTATLFAGDTILETRTTTFKLRKGYLNPRKYFNTMFIASPVVWEITKAKNFIGLTAENKLVVISSTAYTPMILIVPLSLSSEQYSVEYNRIE
jgi:hypothetical protein